jgi:hypothetical protein
MVRENSPIYCVHMDKKTTKSATKFFVVTQLRRDEFGVAVFHGIGYWTNKEPSKEPSNEENIEVNIIEVWIPWNKIDHVENLVYRQRS